MNWRIRILLEKAANQPEKRDVWLTLAAQWMITLSASRT
jgi:hypothetical protein